jgi:hypothetical protein
MIIFSLVCSAIFVGGACTAYMFGVRSAGGMVLFFVGGLLATMFSLTLNPALLANAVLLVVCGIICRGTQTSPRGFARAALTCTVFVYAVACLSHVPRFLEWQRVRERYPIESLAQRLDYERQAIAGRSATRRSAEVGDEAAQTGPGPARTSTLAALEDALEQHEWPWRSRAAALRMVHSSYVEQFIDSPGFGVIRSIRMREPERYADAREPRVFKLPPADSCDLDGTPTDGPASAPAVEVARTPAPRQLETLHETSLFDFINRPGWGYVQDRDRVAGFQPHQFRELPVIPTAASAAQRPADTFELASAHERHNRDEPTHDADQNWQVRGVQLVSLLRHNQPMVYVTDELPRMDRLVEVEVRPLDAFEERSLRLLERGQDVSSDSADQNRIRLLGAIRAAEQCLKCHSVERGDLLGAFSYVIERTQPSRPRRDPSDPVF